MKRIIKARVGTCVNTDTDDIRYQLQFKAEGEVLFNGFSIDTFETNIEANNALKSHINGEIVYKPFASLGGMNRYFMCCKAEKDFKESMRVHLLPDYFGNRLYYFTKDSKHCLLVEYDPKVDFGEGSPSGARIENVEIYTNNSFESFEGLTEISLSEVPKCILELLTYLK